MDGFEIEKLSESNGLRRLWQTYDILYAVQRECTGTKGEIYGGPDKFRTQIASNELVVLIASHVDGIIGGLSYHAIAPNAISLDFLGVMENYRGRGIGGKLIDQLVHDISSETETIIKLHCKQDSSVFDFYQKKGFQPNWNRATRTFIKMELLLKGRVD